jgi:hypothetical protein
MLLLVANGGSSAPRPTYAAVGPSGVDAAKAALTADDLGPSFRLTTHPYSTGPGADSVYAASFIGFIDESLVQVGEVIVASADVPVSETAVATLEHIADGDRGEVATLASGPVIGDSCTWWEPAPPRVLTGDAESFTVVFRVGNHAAAVQVRAEPEAIGQKYAIGLAETIATRLAGL